MSYHSLFIIQVIIILIACKIVGLLFKKIHQPQVVGEMVTGIVLGPSLLGAVLPNMANWLFPSESLGLLFALSQIGLLIYMFVIGLEFNFAMFQERIKVSAIITAASIIVPFCFGVLFSIYLYPEFSNENVSFTQFSLFLGMAMSVTAFPVLARILTERNMLNSEVGIIAISSAAVNDVIAWFILAVVIMLVRSSGAGAFWATAVGSAFYVFVMLLFVRRALKNLERAYQRENNISQDLLAVIIIVVLFSALVSEWLGLHTIFGAFFVGVIMPKDRQFVHRVGQKLGDLTSVLFLPLFFVYTGLRTEIGLINGIDMWLYCAAIIIVAIVGKFGATTLAARAIGMKWRVAGSIGILMNTRGLMELVVLNIGLELRIISSSLFTMMIFMTIVTTFITTPFLELIYPKQDIKENGVIL